MGVSVSKLLLERPMSAADALGCLANTTDFEGTVLTATTNNHYDDTSDSPAWSQNPATVVNGVDTTSWKRMLTSLSGDAVINTSGTTTATGTTVSTATGNISDMHGDTIANIDLTPGTQSVSSTSAYDEYGAPIQTPDLTQPGKYGWIGTKSRLATLGGIILMGARLYNPTTGRFLQVDPIRGGNANAYSYPADPILGFDLDGKFGWKKFAKKMWKKVKQGANWVKNHPLEALEAIVDVACFIKTVAACAVLAASFIAIKVYKGEMSKKEAAAQYILLVSNIKSMKNIKDANEVLSAKFRMSDKQIQNIERALSTPSLILNYAPRKHDW